MARILYDFKCTDCNHLQENLVDSSITEVECEVCGHRATRQISAPTIALDGTDPGFPTAWDKWAKSHERAKH